MRRERVGERRAIMDDTKTTDAAKTAEPRESTNTPEVTKPAETSEPSDAMRMTKLGEDIGEARTSQVGDSTAAADDHRPGLPAATADVRPATRSTFPLQMTQQTWLIAATVLLGLVALLIFGRGSAKNKATAVAHEEQGVASLTPESLMVKCGPPAEDTTKDLYPMVKRTMSYKPSGKGTLTFEFSRTSHEKSDWLFLSMSDENGATYATPETQMAAMPCLK
jgi:hypothetical protein